MQCATLLVVDFFWSAVETAMQLFNVQYYICTYVPPYCKRTKKVRTISTLPERHKAARIELTDQPSKIWVQGVSKREISEGSKTNVMI